MHNSTHTKLPMLLLIVLGTMTDWSNDYRYVFTRFTSSSATI